MERYWKECLDPRTINICAVGCEYDKKELCSSGFIPANVAAGEWQTDLSKAPTKTRVLIIADHRGECKLSSGATHMFITNDITKHKHVIAFAIINLPEVEP